ncbi:S-layer homology domain-containing protein, partial [Enorma phocaeensis]|uniref:S-layer homology domain-containing protein n=1 Tax=Enorma phocaeensis TaxID=1871019 RepID=UPI00195EC6A4
MTACVKNHSKRVALAISASLVGALTLGAAAPAVAFAANEGIQPLIAGDLEDVAKGEITKATDNNGKIINDLDDITFVADTNAHYVVPTQVTTDSGRKITVGEEGTKAVYYKADPNGREQLQDGTKVSWIAEPKTIAGAGTYYAAVCTTDATNASETVAIKFTIVDTTLDGAYVCQGSDINDRVIQYNGNEQTFGSGKLQVVVGGVAYKANTGKMGNIKAYRADDPTHTPVKAKDAGKYVAEGEFDGKDFSVEFEITPIDLATAPIELDELLYATTASDLPGHVAKLDGNTLFNSGSAVSTIDGINVELSFVSTDSGQKTPASPLKGSYTYKITAYKLDTDGKKEATPNIINDREVTVVRYGDTAKFEYDNASFPNGRVIEHFDASLVTARDTNGKLLDGVEISYEKKVDGKWVACDASETSRRGEYKATVVAVDNDYNFGGSVACFFSVNATQVKDADIFVYYDGDVIDGSASDVYSGSDFLDLITVKATDKDGNVVSNDEFDITVTKGGEKVDSIVDAGTYTITVDAKADSLYEVTGTDKSVEFTVDPVDTSDGGNAQIRFAGTLGYGMGTGNMFAYTGQPVVPTFEYDLDESGTKYEKPENWIALPESAYTVEYQRYDEVNDKWVDVEQCVEKGKYRVILTDVNTDGNHYVDNTKEFWITTKRVFADVANDQWYSKWVYTASSDDFGYMTGYTGTQFFGPNDSIKRGDVAVVLYKMAGGTLYSDAHEGEDVPAKEFKTGFSDVDASMYYAQAIQWAEKLGLVTGYDGTDLFMPEASVSRQELATMLARYAKMTGVDTDADLSALDAYTDGASVADFADEAVAWAVEAGVMGQDVDALRPADAISRAEVAAMT